MSYAATLETLSERTERVIMQLWAAVGRGDIDLATFQEIAAPLIARANAHGVILADLALAAATSQATGQAIVAASMASPHHTDPARISGALATILGTDPEQLDPEPRLARLARSEPVNASQRAYSDGIKRSGWARGWVRDLNGDGCQLCTWWWREGRIWPKNHEMPTHVGCQCIPKPVFARNIRETEAMRKERRTAEAMRNRARSDAQRRGR